MLDRKDAGDGRRAGGSRHHGTPTLRQRPARAPHLFRPRPVRRRSGTDGLFAAIDYQADPPLAALQHALPDRHRRRVAPHRATARCGTRESLPHPCASSWPKTTTSIVASRPAWSERLGCEVDAVCNGREAVEMLDYSRHDVVLMDVQMPEMDGFSATADDPRARKGDRPSYPDRRHDRPCDAGGSGAVPGRRDGRIRLQAAPRRGAPRRACSPLPPTTCAPGRERRSGRRPVGGRA